MENEENASARKIYSETRVGVVWGEIEKLSGESRSAAHVRLGRHWPATFDSAVGVFTPVAHHLNLVEIGYPRTPNVSIHDQ